MSKKIKIKDKKKEIKPSPKLSIKTDEAKSTNDKRVVFSFEHFGDKTHGLECAAEEFKCLIKHLKSLSKMTWQQIQGSGRHQLGSEEITVSEIREPISTTKEKVLSFRYSGKKPFIGERKDQILDIYYIDPNFDLYDHK